MNKLKLTTSKNSPMDFTDGVQKVSKGEKTMFDYRNQPNAHSDAKQNRSMPKNTALAQAYVPEQLFQALYSPEKALTQGTAFQELDMPYNKPGHTRR
jgi:hypothetical protein